MAASATTPEVFTRKASGLVRVMSPYSAFVYNILTMGLIFPWTYLWAPGALPGGNLFWGIILATAIEIPIAYAYVWLSTALPRSGGDYVFQSRVFGGGVAFTIVMSGFVIWILQWVALSGWLVSYLGFAPLFLGLGATMGNAAFTGLGVWFTQSTGIIVTSFANALLALVLLVSGFKNYVRFQHAMWWGTLLAFGVVFFILFTTSPSEFVTRLNAFALASGGQANFYETAVNAVTAAGINLRPPFSLWATLLVAPIAWTSLQWATYSSQQNGEIKDARNFGAQTFIMVGSLVVTGLLLALLALGIERVAGKEFLYVAGAGYWSLIGEANIAGFNLWPPILAVALTASPLVVLIIGLGYILNGFQIVCNCYIGMTRVMVAMSLDRLLPEWFSKVDEKLHTPVNSHIAYFLASIPVILAYNMVPGWIGLTLGVTFGCGYVFVITCLAGALLPYRAKELYEASPGSQYKLGGLPLVTVLGVLGAVLGALMVAAFLFTPALGVLGNWNFEAFPSNLWAQIIAFAIILISLVWYLWAKNSQKTKGINVDFAFKEIPPE